VGWWVGGREYTVGTRLGATVGRGREGVRDLLQQRRPLLVNLGAQGLAFAAPLLL